MKHPNIVDSCPITKPM